MAKLGKRDGLKHHCPKGLAGSNPAPGTLRGRADRRVRGPSGPAAERPGAGSTAATARRRTPEGEYDVTDPRTLLAGQVPNLVEAQQGRAADAARDARDGGDIEPHPPGDLATDVEGPSDRLLDGRHVADNDDVVLSGLGDELLARGPDPAADRRERLAARRPERSVGPPLGPDVGRHVPERQPV